MTNQQDNDVFVWINFVYRMLYIYMHQLSFIYSVRSEEKYDVISNSFSSLPISSTKIMVDELFLPNRLSVTKRMNIEEKNI
jgi:hypothetical protein